MSRPGTDGPKKRRPRGARPADLASRIHLAQRGLQRRLERHDTLASFVHALNSTLDPAKIGLTIVERANEWLPAPCWVVLASDLSGRLTVMASQGADAELTQAAEAVGAWVVRHAHEFFSADLRTDSRVSHAHVGTALSIPLACRGRRMGALVGLDREPSSREPALDPHALTALQEALEPAAAALDSAMQVRRAEALAVIDDLTRLYNSRFLNLMLRRETKRAVRTGQALTLLFIDLDGFKRVNDTYGHLSGSRALVEVAAVIRGGAREADIVARFGGDEFALLLPETGSEGARAVAERIRDKVAACSFLADDGLDVRITASIGVATLPDVARSGEELVEAADRAMYEAKKSGGNGMRAAAPADNAYR